MFVKYKPWAVPMVLRSPDDGAGGAGGSGGEGDGGAGTGDDKGGGDGDKTVRTVPLADFKAKLDENQLLKKQMSDLRTQFEAMKAESASKRTKEHEDKGDFKSLYEQTKNELTEFKTKHEQFKKDVINTSRYSNLESELKKMGLKESSQTVIDFADLEKMPFETTSKGRIIIHGVEEMAKHLKTNYPFAFDAQKASNINTGGGSGGSASAGGDGKVTAQMVIEAEDAAKRDPKKVPAYHELHKKYVQQIAHSRAQGG